MRLFWKSLRDEGEGRQHLGGSLISAQASSLDLEPVLDEGGTLG